MATATEPRQQSSSPEAPCDSEFTRSTVARYAELAWRFNDCLDAEAISAMTVLPLVFSGVEPPKDRDEHREAMKTFVYGLIRFQLWQDEDDEPIADMAMDILEENFRARFAKFGAKPSDANSAPRADIGIVPGELLTISIPRLNKSGKIVGLKRRRLIVRRVRDLAAEPFSLTEWIDQPMPYWGRFMVIGHDPETGRVVSVPLDWNVPRRFRIYRDGEPTEFRMLRLSRLDRACFDDLCNQSIGEVGLTVGPILDEDEDGADEHEEAGEPQPAVESAQDAAPDAGYLIGA